MKTIISILFIVIYQASSIAQTALPKPFFSDVKFEITSQSLLVTIPSGVLIRGKKQFFNSKHFEGYAGVGFQYYGLTFNQDEMAVGDQQSYHISSALVLADILYYPFNSKGFFVGIEPFVGLSMSNSKSSFKLPQLGINKTHEHTFLYFNYGTNHSIGYTYKKWSFSACLMLSHRGLYGEGRFRFPGADSFAFTGITLSYKL